MTKITHEDRELLIAVMDIAGVNAARILNGEADNLPTAGTKLALLARHREQAQAEMLEAAERIMWRGYVAGRDLEALRVAVAKARGEAK